MLKRAIESLLFLNNNIRFCKNVALELKDYEKAIERVNELMGDLIGDRKIIVYENKIN